MRSILLAALLIPGVAEAVPAAKPALLAAKIMEAVAAARVEESALGRRFTDPQNATNSAALPQPDNRSHGKRRTTVGYLRVRASPGHRPG